MKNRNDLMVMGTVALGLLLAFFLGFYKPSTSKIQRLQMNVQKYGDLESQKAIVQKAEHDKLQELEKVRNRIADLNRGFLDAEQQGVFMKKLRELVGGLDVEGESVISGGEKRKGDLKHFSYLIRMTGKFEEIYGFLRSLEEMDEFVWFERLQIEQKPIRTGADGLVKLDMTLTVPMAAE